MIFMKSTIFFVLFGIVAHISNAYIRSNWYVIHPGEANGRNYVILYSGAAFDGSEFDISDTIWTESYEAKTGPVNWDLPYFYLSTDHGLHKIRMRESWPLDLESVTIDTSTSSKFKIYGEQLLIYHEGVDSVKVMDQNEDFVWMKIDPDTLLEQRPNWPYDYSWRLDIESEKLFVYENSPFDFSNPLDSLEGVDSVLSFFGGGSRYGFVWMNGDLKRIEWRYSPNILVSSVNASVSDLGFNSSHILPNYWIMSDDTLRVYNGDDVEEEFVQPDFHLLDYTENGYFGLSVDSTLFFDDRATRTELLTIRKEDQFFVGHAIIGGLNNPQLQESIGAFPNPCQNQINLPNDVEFEILTLQGELITQGQKGRYDTSGLLPGTYLIKQGNRIGRFHKL
jgi:hypothetical protein